jgi:hypothetical protein
MTVGCPTVIYFFCEVLLIMTEWTEALLIACERPEEQMNASQS